MAKSNDTIYTRCNDRIKQDEVGFIDSKDIAEYNKIQIDKMQMDYEKLSDFFSKFMAAICLNQMGYRAIGARSGLYINPDKADAEQLKTLFNNANRNVLSKTAVRENIKRIIKNNYPEQLCMDENGNIFVEKSVDEIIEEIRAVI